MSWIDCGVNLHSSQFSDKNQVLAQAESLGVHHFVLISSDLEETQQVLSTCQQYNSCIGTAGVHPHQADSVTLEALESLRELAQHQEIRAIGECGLDYNRNFSEPAQQRSVFHKQVEIACDLRLPLYLHERDAIDDQIAILSEFEAQLPALFIHCFTQGPEALERYMRFNPYIGITGWVCDERRGESLQQALSQIPQNRLLLETDAPYLLPRTLRPKPRSRVNYPHYLPHIGEVVAKLRGQDEKELAAITSQNAKDLFGVWGLPQ
ncbi:MULTISPECIES: TatD family hydrolase [Gammaproteobacteria]|uniref:TatD family hydrolase n=1 Tax=Gammaproteobacteria TaxID=1236 RepID=UPI000DCF7649|nr:MULTISPECIES: TatD family hydrolase [Gammaproteobacteria]RTE85760.1 hydrolase TatD [Aliidiomarina sp. B3213]TCZ90237.1 hydrolase TatD [Lysobacter sp. N42]